MPAFLKLFDIVPGWVYAALVALALLGTCAEREVMVGAQRDAATAREEASNQKAVLAVAQAAAEESHREVDVLRLQAAQGVADHAREEFRKTEIAVAAGGAERKRLLAATAEASAPSASGQGLRDPGALTRAEQRATAFGQLLGRCDAVAERVGRYAEDLATQVRGLQRQYASLRPTGSDPLPDRDQVDPGAAANGDRVVDAPQPLLLH